MKSWLNWSHRLFYYWLWWGQNFILDVQIYSHHICKGELLFVLWSGRGNTCAWERENNHWCWQLYRYILYISHFLSLNVDTLTSMASLNRRLIFNQVLVFIYDLTPKTIVANLKTSIVFRMRPFMGCYFTQYGSALVVWTFNWRSPQAVHRESGWGCICFKSPSLGTHTSPNRPQMAWGTQMTWIYTTKTNLFLSELHSYASLVSEIIQCI